MAVGQVIILLFSTLVIVLIALLLFLLFKLLLWIAGGGNSRERRADENETRVIQDLHAQMKQMEKRIESLETILLDQIKTRTKRGED